MVPVHKHFTHRAGVFIAHSKLRIRKIDRATHALDLRKNGAAVFARPIPARVQKLFAADLQARNTFAFELFVNLSLGSDTCVIGTQNPARRAATHALEANIGVLDRVVHGMTHVQNARYIGRRNNHRAVTNTFIALVAAMFHPLLDESRFGTLRIIGFWHLFHVASLYPS